MANDGVRLGEAHELTRLLFRVVDLVQEDFREVVAAEGLTPPLARMVLMLEEPQTMRTLAEHLRCDASNVTGLTDRLATRDLVDRVPGEDRRTKMVTLTEQGRLLRSRLVSDVAEGSTVMRRLSDRERAVLRPLLEGMLVNGRQDGTLPGEVEGVT